MTADDCSLVRTYLAPEVARSWEMFDPQEVEDARRALFKADRRSAFSTASPAFRTWALTVLFAWLENHYRHL